LDPNVKQDLSISEALSLLTNGILFTADLLRQFKHGDRCTYEGAKPSRCANCRSTKGPFHRHGYYTRFILTLRDSAVVLFSVHILRYLCRNCRHTMSELPDGILPRQRLCSLLILYLMWRYLFLRSGYYSKQPMPEGTIAIAVDERTVARIIFRAKRTAQDTHQAIRLVIADKMEPGPVESYFRGGLSPPEAILKWHRTDHYLISVLYGMVHMLCITSYTQKIALSLLLARAHWYAKERGTRFLQ